CIGCAVRTACRCAARHRQPGPHHDERPRRARRPVRSSVMRIAKILLIGAAACSSATSSGPDPGAIVVKIMSPSPGDEMIAVEQPMIRVTGTVTTTDPAYGVLQAWVNGTPVGLDANGAFSTQLVPVVGINHIQVDGGDGFGTVISKQLDVLWAPDYIP